jgi:hypothetical protein
MQNSLRFLANSDNYPILCVLGIGQEIVILFVVAGIQGRNGRYRVREPLFSMSDVNVNVFAADFTGKDLGSLQFAPTGTVLETDAPAVPVADDLAGLDDAFT